jgi:hypothetical protein
MLYVKIALVRRASVQKRYGVPLRKITLIILLLQV